MTACSHDEQHLLQDVSDDEFEAACRSLPDASHVEDVSNPTSRTDNARLTLDTPVQGVRTSPFSSDRSLLRSARFRDRNHSTEISEGSRVEHFTESGEYCCDALLDVRLSRYHDQVVHSRSHGVGVGCRLGRPCEHGAVQIDRKMCDSPVFRSGTMQAEHEQVVERAEPDETGIGERMTHGHGLDREMLGWTAVWKVPRRAKVQIDTNPGRVADGDRDRSEAGRIGRSPRHPPSLRSENGQRRSDVIVADQEIDVAACPQPMVGVDVPEQPESLERNCGDAFTAEPFEHGPNRLEDPDVESPGHIGLVSAAVLDNGTDGEDVRSRSEKRQESCGRVADDPVEDGVSTTGSLDKDVPCGAGSVEIGLGHGDLE